MTACKYKQVYDQSQQPTRAPLNKCPSTDITSSFTRGSTQVLPNETVWKKAGILSFWPEQGKTPRLTYVAVPATVEF
jgi:hypothetical protein